MVSRDLSFFEGTQTGGSDIRIASVFDRLLAFFIDFLVFSPIVSLAGAFVLRDFRALSLEESGSTALSLVWFSLLGGSFLLCVLAESLFVYFKGGTPGQIFMQLEVRPFPSRERMGLLQCLMRTVLWWLSVPLMLPLLGVYTNRYRRALHDRGSETIVVTKKVVGDPGPAELEVHFFRSWSQIFVLFLLFVAVGTLVEVRRLVQSGVFSSSDASESRAMCDAIDRQLSGLARLDRAVSGFLAGKWDKECLQLEADLAMWDGDESTRPLANVAMSLSLEDAESETAKAYLSRVCEIEKDGEPCGIARYLRSTETDRGDILRAGGVTSVTGRMLLARESVDRGQIAAAASLIKDLRSEDLLEAWLERQEVRAFWKLKNESKGREPASDETRKLLEDFESRYDLR